MAKKIVLLCSNCFSTVTLYNHISKYYTIDNIITEERMRGITLAKKRIKKQGLFRVAGQVAFSALIVPAIRAFSQKRVATIKKKYSFDETKLPAEKITHFNSVNDEACISLLEQLRPDIVLVNGTRILSVRMLNRIPAVFINMHTGITPGYRGVHGGYWAIVQNDNENCGVTVHLVDKGIDTGDILYQSKIIINKQDNFITYPYLQFGEGIPLVKKSIHAAELNNLQPKPNSGAESKLWYHPTIWQYLYYRLFRNKK